MTRTYSESRRIFLKSVAAAGGTIALLPKTSSAAQPVRPVDNQKEKLSPGYRETPHIAKYYQSARN